MTDADKAAGLLAGGPGSPRLPTPNRSDQRAAPCATQTEESGPHTGHTRAGRGQQGLSEAANTVAGQEITVASELFLS
jgi:hypothetical protein